MNPGSLITLVNFPGQLRLVNGLVRVCSAGNGAMCRVTSGRVPLLAPRQSWLHWNVKICVCMYMSVYVYTAQAQSQRYCRWVFAKSRAVCISLEPGHAIKHHLKSNNAHKGVAVTGYKSSLVTDGINLTRLWCLPVLPCKYQFSWEV